MAIPRALSFSGLARPARALQADRGRRGVVSHSAFPDHARSHAGVRQTRKHALRRVSPILSWYFVVILPWQFFATALSESGNSLVANTGLISKVYFPRLVIPAGSLITALVDFLISLAFLGMLMIWYRWVPPATIALLPLFLLLASAASFGVGLWVAALMVEYRDFRIIVPFLIQFGLYISPVGFISSVVPERYRLLYSLNPMVGVIDGFRWCILGGDHTLYWPVFGRLRGRWIFSPPHGHLVLPPNRTNVCGCHLSETPLSMVGEVGSPGMCRG